MVGYEHVFVAGQASSNPPDPPTLPVLEDPEYHIGLFETSIGGQRGQYLSICVCRVPTEKDTPQI